MHTNAALDVNNAWTYTHEAQQNQTPPASQTSRVQKVPNWQVIWKEADLLRQQTLHFRLDICFNKLIVFSLIMDLSRGLSED